MGNQILRSIGNAVRRNLFNGSKRPKRYAHIQAFDAAWRQLPGQRKGRPGSPSSSGTMYNCDFTEDSSGSTALLVEEHPAEIRIDKVQEIRRQLNEGRYCITDRLDAVVETLLKLLGD